MRAEEDNEILWAFPVSHPIPDLDVSNARCMLDGEL